MKKYITSEDLKRFEAEAHKAADNVRGCRMKDKTFHKVVIDSINKATSRKEGTVSAYITVAGYNYGTKKWADVAPNFTITLIDENTRVTDKTIDRHPWSNVIAFVK